MFTVYCSDPRYMVYKAHKCLLKINHKELYFRGGKMVQQVKVLTAQTSDLS